MFFVLFAVVVSTVQLYWSGTVTLASVQHFAAMLCSYFLPDNLRIHILISMMRLDRVMMDLPGR